MDTKPTKPAGSKKGLKVVLIEDEESLRFLYVTKFRQVGYEVLDAANGADGIIAIHEMHPDIVLLDILMPQMSGFEVLQKIKNDPDKSIQDIPVVFLTNLAEDAGYEQAQKLGAAGYVMKVNRTPEQMVHMVEAVVGAAGKHE